MANRKRKNQERPTAEPAPSPPVPPEPSLVGWKFFAGAFVLMLGPCVYTIYRAAYDDMRGTILPWVVGASAAAILAGVLAVVVNTVIEWRASRTNTASDD